MCKLAQSFVIPYYHEIFIFVEQWLIYDCETGCNLMRHFKAIQ